MLRDTWYHILFAFAALWNLAAATGLLFRPQMLLAQLKIEDPAARTLARSFVSSVAAWGIGYALIAFDPIRFRDFAWLGVLSKSLFFLIYAAEFSQKRITFQAFLPAVADLLMALAFLEFLLH